MRRITADELAVGQVVADCTQGEYLITKVTAALWAGSRHWGWGRAAVPLYADLKALTTRPTQHRKNGLTFWLIESDADLAAVRQHTRQHLAISGEYEIKMRAAQDARQRSNDALDAEFGAV